MNDTSLIHNLSETISASALENFIACVPRPSCFLCRHDGAKLYSGLADWLFGVPGVWDIRKCADCDVAWLDPQPLPAEIPKLYATYYTHDRLALAVKFADLRDGILRAVLARMGYPIESRVSSITRGLSHVPSLAHAASLEVMDLPAAQVGELLDVGCGNGSFLERMRALGWGVTGVDPDPGAVMYCEKRGLHVFQGNISDVPAGARYDVITLNHVIEHVMDPVNLLSECARLLRPEGRVVLTTPNLLSLGHRWFKKDWRGLEVPRHFNIFSPSALKQCIGQAGLRLTSLRTETRLARMIYNPSAYAKKGELRIGSRTNYSSLTKMAAYLFQAIEDVWVCADDVGEEIYCVCTIT
jgi:2-polyprenyl-3-methyl-5-hydroxy-6-metoxy-1,4-benzoquinol methylase